MADGASVRFLTRLERALPVAICALVMFTTTSFRLEAADATIAASPSKYAKVDSLRVHYKVLGRGKPTIVFIHGWGGSMEVWRDQAAYFAQKSRVILIDLPGHGGSDKPDVSYSMRLFAQSVDAVLRAAGSDRAILVGHSMGGPIIRQVDRMFPARVRGLVVVDGALRNFFDPDSAKKFVDPLRGADYAAVVKARFAGMMPVASPELRDEVAAMAAATPQNVLISSMEGMTLDQSVWVESQITVPLLVINQKSTFWNDEYVEFVRSIARDTEYQTVEGADHFLMIEKPAEFNALVEGWMVRKGWLRK